MCVTLTKRYDMVLDSEGAVETPRDAHVGCEKLNVKTEMPKFEVERNDNLRPLDLLCYTN